MSKGSIIFLNGTSGAGKTTLAHGLQASLADPYMHVSVDGFFSLYPARLLNPGNRTEADRLARLIPAVVSGLHRSVAALAEAGNNLIVDHVLQEEGWLRECIECWAGFDVLFVGIHCPLEIVEGRERERGDRIIGTARYQSERVHAHGLYDVEVDTSMLGRDEGVAVILDALSQRRRLSAFQELAQRFATERNRVATSKGG